MSAQQGGGQESPRPAGAFGHLLASRARARAVQAALDAAEAIRGGNHAEGQILLHEALWELERADQRERGE